jgi:glycosyltransferase involved in cell wall biosynthesis
VPLADPLFYLACLTLVLVLVIAVELAAGNRKARWLGSIEPAKRGPKVSLVVAARNEQRNVRQAIQSLLSQTYPNLEIIVIDDRSTDSTGRILDELAASDKRLNVVHIKELPPGWLGKCNALHTGAAKATGDWILFADADIVMEKSSVSRAVTFVEEEKLDHLAIGPRIEVTGLLPNAFCAFFGMAFTAYFKPWRVSDPKSRYYIGVGAFNMIRAAAYRSFGGHGTIAMRPDDDMMLGKLVKKHGFRQDVLFGGSLMCVEWYCSFRELVQGLMKNSFAGTGYSVAVVVAATLLHLVGSVWPFAALFLTEGPVWCLNLLIVATLIGTSADSARFYGIHPWYGLTYPLGVLIFFYILWRATIVTLWNDGIDWRGTHYPLKELKANRV